MVIWIFMALMLTVFAQPLIETANVFKDKITLSAAISNSSRVARINALKYEELRDLEADIDEEGAFRRHFAEAFGNTLGLICADPLASRMRFSAPGRQWNDIFIDIVFEYRDSDSGFDRQMAEVRIALETDYAFATRFVEEVSRGGSYRISEERVFMMQIIN
jgi:type IV secretory pathway VirB6-like protein